MRLPSGILAVAFCWIMGALPLLGCDSSPDSAPKGTQEAAPTQSSPQPKKETPLEVDQLAAALHTLASEHQEAIAAADLQQLKSLQTQARERSGSLRDLLISVYPADNTAYRFVGDGLSTPALKAMVEAVRELPSHGISQSYFPVEKLELKQAKVAKLEEEIVELDSRMEPAQLPLLRATLLEMPQDGTVEQFAEALRKRKVGNSALPVVKTLSEELKAKRSVYIQRGEELNELELLSMEAFLEYACEFLHGKVAHPFRAMRNRRTALAAFDDRLLKNVEETDFSQLQAALQDSTPPAPVQPDSGGVGEV